MVHLRINENEPNPNPHVNFISALSMPDSNHQEEARQLLRALAAQVRPVMKANGFAVNSLEEYEFNPVFAGRNWNNGETIELVLRRANGSYYPTSWLMSVFCHELAHIKHMNHGPSFQALWTRLRREVRQLQDRGYYGDGYWSSGTRLGDSARIAGEGIEAGEFPEYMCGGAQTRARPTSRRRRRGPTQRRRETVPSLHTGRQTAKRRKAGGRVTSKFAFVGEGHSLVPEGESSKGKRTTSKRAREERAQAAENRLNALLGRLEPQETHSVDSDTESDSGSEIEFVNETNAERLENLFRSENTSDHSKFDFGKGLSWRDFEEDFKFNINAFPESGSSSKPRTEELSEPPRPRDMAQWKSSNLPEPKSRKQGPVVIELSDEENFVSEEGRYECDIPTASGSTFVAKPSSEKNVYGAKEKAHRQSITNISLPQGNRPRRVESKPSGIGLGKLVQTEIEFRKKEALGLTPSKGGGRTLGDAPKTYEPGKDANDGNSPFAKGNRVKRWSCLVCTLENEGHHLACAACETLRGQRIYQSNVQSC